MTSSVDGTPPQITAKWILVAEGIIVGSAIVWALCFPSAATWDSLASIDSAFLRVAVTALTVFHVAALVMIATPRIAPTSVLLKHVGMGIYGGLILTFFGASSGLAGSTAGPPVPLRDFLVLATLLTVLDWVSSRFFAAIWKKLI